MATRRPVPLSVLDLRLFLRAYGAHLHHVHPHRPGPVGHPAQHRRQEEQGGGGGGHQGQEGGLEDAR